MVQTLLTLLMTIRLANIELRKQKSVTVVLLFTLEKQVQTLFGYCKNFTREARRSHVFRGISLLYIKRILECNDYFILIPAETPACFVPLLK